MTTPTPARVAADLVRAAVADDLAGMVLILKRLEGTDAAPVLGITAQIAATFAWLAADAALRTLAAWLDDLAEQFQGGSHG